MHLISSFFSDFDRPTLAEDGGEQGEGLREGGMEGGTNLIVVTDEGNAIERGGQVDGWKDVRTDRQRDGWIRHKLPPQIKTWRSGPNTFSERRAEQREKDKDAISCRDRSAAHRSRRIWITRSEEELARATREKWVKLGASGCWGVKNNRRGSTAKKREKDMKGGKKAQ